MKVERLTRAQVYERLATPFNPPLVQTKEDEDAFLSEWYDTNRALLRVLERFGEHNDYDDADFNLGDSAMLSRGIGVTFTSDRMHKPEVLTEIVRFLRSLSQSYEVNIVVRADFEEYELYVSSFGLLSELPDKLHQAWVIPAAAQLSPNSGSANCDAK